MFIVAFCISFYQGWQLTLVILGIIPFLLFSGLLFGVFGNKKK
jgi:ABC-type multidrug transport system fused ATPase/permease subunit